MTLRPQIGGFFDYGGTFSSLQNGQMLAMAGIGDWITGTLERNGGHVRSVIPEEGGLQWTGVVLDRQGHGQGRPREEVDPVHHLARGPGEVQNMTAYPALIPNKAGWELLARETPEEAKRQGMLLDDPNNPVELIRRDASSTASFPVQQSPRTGTTSGRTTGAHDRLHPTGPASQPGPCRPQRDAGSGTSRRSTEAPSPFDGSSAYGLTFSCRCCSGN